MHDHESTATGGQGKFALVSIRLPVALTFAALVGGLWLRALQMTIIPLVAALLVLGLVQMILAARVGTAARRMIAIMVAVQLAGGTFTSLAMPALLAAFFLVMRNQAALAYHVIHGHVQFVIGAVFVETVDQRHEAADILRSSCTQHPVRHCSL